MSGAPALALLSVRRGLDAWERVSRGALRGHGGSAAWESRVSRAVTFHLRLRRPGDFLFHLGAPTPTSGAASRRAGKYIWGPRLESKKKKRRWVIPLFINSFVKAPNMSPVPVRGLERQHRGDLEVVQLQVSSRRACGARPLCPRPGRGRSVYAVAGAKHLGLPSTLLVSLPSAVQLPLSLPWRLTPPPHCWPVGAPLFLSCDRAEGHHP